MKAHHLKIDFLSPFQILLGINFRRGYEIMEKEDSSDIKMMTTDIQIGLLFILFTYTLYEL